MAKQPIGWHQELLKDMMLFQLQETAALDAMQQAVTKRQARIERLQQQIERAVREGRDGFDADRFEPKKGGE